MNREERREYMRRWRQDNREKLREQKKERETRLAIAALANVERVTDDICVVKTTDGHTFTLIRKKGES